MPFNCGDRTGLVNRAALNLGGILYGMFEQMAGYARLQINGDRTVRAFGAF